MSNGAGPPRSQWGTPGSDLIEFESDFLHISETEPSDGTGTKNEWVTKSLPLTLDKHSEDKQQSRKRQHCQHV